MTCLFSRDYRTVQDREGNVVRLSPVQGEILAYMHGLGCSCTQKDLRDHLQEIGRQTQSIKHAFYAAEGRRVWGRLVVPVPGVQGHLQLDLSFVAKARVFRRRRVRAERKPRRPDVGEMLMSVASLGFAAGLNGATGSGGDRTPDALGGGHGAQSGPLPRERASCRSR